MRSSVGLFHLKMSSFMPRGWAPGNELARTPQLDPVTSVIGVFGGAGVSAHGFQPCPDYDTKYVRIHDALYKKDEGSPSCRFVLQSHHSKTWNRREAQRHGSGLPQDWHCVAPGGFACKQRRQAFP
jgi:hypothetical protein